MLLPNLVETWVAEASKALVAQTLLRLTVSFLESLMVPRRPGPWKISLSPSSVDSI